MSTLLKPFLVREELLNRKVRIFTPLEFMRIFPASPASIKYFLEEQVDAGLLLRLKKGLYTLRTDLPSEEEIANKLWQPSYLSFEYALAYYNILPEMTYIITSATTKTTRIFALDYQTFGYYTIKKEAYTGYVLQRTERKSFLIAEPEKALVDYLYFVSIGKRPENDRLNTSNLDKGKILKYVQLYDRPRLELLIPS